MSKRVIAIIVIVLVLVAAVLLAVFVHPGAKAPANSAAQQASSSSPATSAGASATPAVVTPPPPPPDFVSIQVVGKLFAERYGSYSTEANFANLTDTLPLMTDAFAAKTRAYMQTSQPATTFYGVTTRAVSLTASALDAANGTATATVSTQRTETVGTAAPVTKYQLLVLTLVKVGADWKIDSAVWK